jgi:hypothetical protein
VRGFFLLAITRGQAVLVEFSEDTGLIHRD